MVSKVSSRAFELAFKFKLGQVSRDHRLLYHSGLSPEVMLHQVPFSLPKWHEEALEEIHLRLPTPSPALSLQQKGAQLLHSCDLPLLGLTETLLQDPADADKTNA